MHRTLSLTLSIIACAFAGQAFADDITIDNTPFTSARTRAEVQAELKEFRAAGIDPWADNYAPIASFGSDKTRAQVRAEYLGSRDKVAAFQGEDSGSVYLAQRRESGKDLQMAGDPADVIDAR